MSTTIPRLVKASASCDAATMDALPDYLQKGRMGAKLELGGRNPDPEARRKARTAHVRQAALRPDGTVSALSSDSKRTSPVNALTVLPSSRRSTR